MGNTSSSNASAPTISVRVAYFWWLSLFFGAHRFYVGKWLTALAYPVFILVFLTFADALTTEQFDYFGLTYLGFLLLDACLIPRWVRQRNAWFEEDFRTHPSRYLIPDTDDIAPWARGQSRKEKSGLRRGVFRVYFFFWLVPFFTGISAAELHSLEVLIIPIVVLAAIGLISTLDRMLVHQPVILEIPGVGPALERVADMRAYFWNNEPKVSRSIWGMFRHWKEFKPYWTLALVVAATVVIEGVISYVDNTQYIGLMAAAKIVGSAALIAGFVVLANLVPITALSFHYSLSGKRTRLRFMTAGALVATVLGFYIQPYLFGDEKGSGKIPSYLSQVRLEERMKDADFRQELLLKMDVFLWYYINQNIDVKTMNEDFRSLLKGLVPNDESDAFEIMEREDWAAVLYYHSGASCNLEDEPGSPDQLVDDQAVSTDQDVIPRYSLLAVVVKNTDLLKIAKLQYLPDELAYEDFDSLDDERKLAIIEYVNNRMIYYQWDDFLKEYIAQPECQSSLLCDDAFGGCPWLDDEAL